MKITEVIEKCDAFYPNDYTFDEKLYWAYEVSCRIANEIKETFGRIKLTKAGDEFIVPPGIRFEDIYKVIADGREIKKVDEFNAAQLNGELGGAKEVEIVYKKRLCEYGEKLYMGKISFVYDSENNTSTFEVKDNEIMEGDTLKIDNAKYEVIKTDGDYVTVEGEISGEKEVGIKVLVTDETLCEAPYEAMYIYYILSQILFNQSDVDGYNRYITMFQSLFAEYAMYYRRNSPDYSAKYKNLW